MEAVLLSYLSAFESPKQNTAQQWESPAERFSCTYLKNNKLESNSAQMKGFCFYNSKQVIKALCSRIMAAASSVHMSSNTSIKTTAPPQLQYARGLYELSAYSSSPHNPISTAQCSGHSSMGMWRAERRKDVLGWLSWKPTLEPGCHPRFPAPLQRSSAAWNPGLGLGHR